MAKQPAQIICGDLTITAPTIRSVENSLKRVMQCKATKNYLNQFKLQNTIKSMAPNYAG